MLLSFHFQRHQFFSLFFLLIFLLTGCAQHKKSIFQDPNGASSQYSECFHAVRNDLCNGLHGPIRAKLDTIDAELQQKHQYDDGFAEDMGMLNLLEIASLYLHTGSVEKSLEYSNYAECLIEKRNNDPELWELLRKGSTMLTPLIGGGQEYSVYDPVGYEKVLLLNIQAMDYLLKGDDRAFNVALKSTDWQELEREKFEQQIEALKQQPGKHDDEEEGVRVDPQKENRNQAIKNKVFDRLAKEYAQYDKKAVKIPSAFVNPFGDYLAGVAKEYKSVDADFRSQMDNARIHYDKARKLNPKSRVLKLAYQDAQKRRSAKRLVQIVAFDGFVPEKNIFKFDILLKQCPVPIHLEVPVYDPVESKVEKIVASTAGGRVLATFRPVADVEALALRHQKDMLPAVQALVAVAAIRDAAIQTVGHSVSDSVKRKFGENSDMTKSIQKLVGGFMGALDRGLEPDTSSWMSLPKRILAARFHPPKNLKTIVITSYDARGKRLAREKVQLGKGGRHFIFVRTTDKAMKVIPGKKIWSPKEKIKRIDC